MSIWKESRELLIKRGMVQAYQDGEGITTGHDHEYASWTPSYHNGITLDGSFGPEVLRALADYIEHYPYTAEQLQEQERLRRIYEEDNEL